MLHLYRSKIIYSRSDSNELDVILPAELERIHTLPKPLVFTNGCFDILHIGHVDYLEQAKSKGASLVVGINSDDSVRSLNKSPERPINTLEHRMGIVAALESVDLVLSFNLSDPLRIIEQIKPDILIKGGDWNINRIIGAKLVMDNGGTVLTIPLEFHTSTTSLISKIQKTKSITPP